MYCIGILLLFDFLEEAKTRSEKCTKKFAFTIADNYKIDFSSTLLFVSWELFFANISRSATIKPLM